MTEAIKMVAALVVGVALGAVVAGMTAPKGDLGGVTIEDETFVGTVTAQDFVSTDDITSGDDVVVGDNLINSAAALCIEYHATSTATTLKLTASTTNPVGGVNTNLVAAYGTCN